MALLADGHDEADIPALIDGEAAALILRDFLQNNEPRKVVIEDPGT
jgi:hypothetical protein